MNILINRDSNSLYLKKGGSYYAMTLLPVLIHIRETGSTGLPSEEDLNKYGLCYTGVRETLTEVSESQLISMAR